jgi:hypothetical protein
LRVMQRLLRVCIDHHGELPFTCAPAPYRIPAGWLHLYHVGALPPASQPERMQK